jgi:hypothetical protein
MQVPRLLSIVTVMIVGSACGSAHAMTATVAGVSASDAVQVRVFYLQAMAVRDAMTMVRSQAKVRSVAGIDEPRVLIVRDVAQVVDQCESLLRQRDAGLRVVTPHGPVKLEAAAGEPLESRVFITVDDGVETVTTVLRSIYSIRKLNARPGDATVSVDATQPVLDAIEALLSELDLLFPDG